MFLGGMRTGLFGRMAGGVDHTEQRRRLAATLTHPGPLAAGIQNYV